jgi:hypothetical protein
VVLFRGVQGCEEFSSIEADRITEGFEVLFRDLNLDTILRLSYDFGSQCLTHGVFSQLLCGHSLLFRQRRQASEMLLLSRIHVERDLGSRLRSASEDMGIGAVE